MSPAYHGLVYGYGKKINVEVVGGNWSHPTVDEEQIEVYDKGQMKWRGEMFVTCGEFKINSPVFTHSTVELQTLITALL